MPRKKNTLPKRAPKGQGSITQRTYTRDGVTYTMWRARCYFENPDTGLQEQKEFTGSTQKEVLSKMKEAQRQVENGTYVFNQVKYTLIQWLDEWSANYLNGVKPRTVETYKTNINQHFRASKIAKVKLTALTPLQVQKLLNSLVNVKTGEPLSAKTLKNVHSTLHAALQRAVDIGLINRNPADRANLPKVTTPEIKPLDEKDIAKLLQVIQGSEYADIITVTLFLGLRQGEACGLTWDEIDFKAGTVTIKHQLLRNRGSGADYYLALPKNSKARTLRPAKSIINLLKDIKSKQFDQMQEAAGIWNNDLGFVFVHADGSHFSPQTLYLKFKVFADMIGRPDARYHDLRHSYAVQSLRNGDDIKTVQNNLGHHTAAFTLQTYAHVTESMLNDSADRMEAFITSQKVKIG